MSRRCALLVVLACAPGGCGGSGHRTTQATTTPPRPVVTASTLRTPSPHRRHHRAPRPAPGTLPQTHQLPSSHTSGFRTEMRALWTAIATGSARRARAAFFPQAAYVQVKAIAGAAADYRARLMGDFDLDVAAAHALLNGGGAHARLVEVRVPDAHWVAPGVCLNRIGYWEVPNARLVYEQGGQTRSFGIASMISWRGVWYVVHLGAVVRQTTAGVVDDPSPGPGTSVPSSTC